MVKATLNEGPIKVLIEYCQVYFPRLFLSPGGDPLLCFFLSVLNLRLSPRNIFFKRPLLIT